MLQMGNDTVVEVLDGMVRDAKRLRVKLIAVSASADAAGEIAVSLLERIRFLAELLLDSEKAARLGTKGGGKTDASVARVARRFENNKMPDQSYLLSIDFSNEWIALSPLQGALLDMLSSGTPEPGEDISGWVSKNEIHAWLQKRGEKPYRLAFVHNLMNQLRRKLGKHAVFLHSSRARGFRFAKKVAITEHALRTRLAGASARHAGGRHIESRGREDRGMAGRAASTQS